MRIAIYPHYGEYTAHFGDAIKLAKVVNHEAFGVTFNLCHNLANGDEAQIPTLINGAPGNGFSSPRSTDARQRAYGGANWDKLIQPLGGGNVSHEDRSRWLDQIHFTGPIGFQGYGIKGDPRAMLELTIKAWRASQP